MSTHTDGFRPSLVAALVKVAMIGTWRGRTFLDDNLELDDIVDFVPDEPAARVRLSVDSAPSVSQPSASQPLEASAADPKHPDTGHSVAA